MPNFLTFDEDFVLRLFVNDETGIGSVFAEFDNTQYELLDDGNHNDSLANDNIYGNTITGYSLTNPLTQTAINVNNITMPMDNRGILADVNPITYQDLIVSVNDVDDNTTELIEEKRISSVKVCLDVTKVPAFFSAEDSSFPVTKMMSCGQMQSQVLH
ncbi:MAG: choice-of-anchor X domain-containing protein [Melioribacteraceae bacterium]|nr:choice-of-anchor X domain-containing protein [Melioribacteraceae bacterium]